MGGWVNAYPPPFGQVKISKQRKKRRKVWVENLFQQHLA
jgi:hypothetical protein